MRFKDSRTNESHTRMASFLVCVRAVLSSSPMSSTTSPTSSSTSCASADTNEAVLSWHSVTRSLGVSGGDGCRTVGSRWAELAADTPTSLAGLCRSGWRRPNCLQHQSVLKKVPLVASNWPQVFLRGQGGGKAAQPS